MKRFLLLLVLLLAVPLQSSWAAAGRYCEYEDGAVTSHFGHHSEHHHHAQSDRSDGGYSTKVHHDCNHHTGGLGIVSASEAVIVSVSRAFHEAGLPVAPPFPPPSRLERPKWSSAAF